MIVIGIILVSLVLVRLLLPYVALLYINRVLSRIKQHQGRVRRITINLLRGHYVFHDIELNKVVTDSSDKPFLTASRIDLSLQWKALFRKSIVATAVIEQPEVNFTKEKENPYSELKDHSDLKTLLSNQMPFTIDLGIRGGVVHYMDNTSKAKIDFTVTNLTACVREFSNMPAHEGVPASINVSANVYGGTCNFTMKLFPMAERLAFDMNTELKNINLVLLNEFFRAYAKIDVNQGTFDMYTEVAAKEGVFKGYVKPVIRDLDIVGAEDRNDTVFRKLWERLVAGAYQIMKNKKEDQMAAKISIEGRLDHPHINIFAALITIFQNAFVHAIRPSLDDVINIASVRQSVSKAKGFIKKIFSREEA